MGTLKLDTYKQNARPGPPLPGSKAISALFRKLSKKDLPKGNVGLAIRIFVKHLYYQKTSILLPEDSNIADAEESLKTYIKNHPELNDIRNDESDVDDELYLDEQTVKEEEIELKNQDDSEYDIKISFSKLTMSDKYPHYVPEAAYQSLDFAERRLPEYAKNLLAFYRFKHEGAFAGKSEDASVLIVAGKIRAYGKTKWDNSSFPVLSYKEKENYLWRTIKEEPYIIEKKRHITRVAAY